MKAVVVSICVVMITTLASPVQSLLFAEVYQWTDADGSTHFSDTPMKAPKGKKPVIRQDGSDNNPTSNLRTQVPPVPVNYGQTSKPRPSMEPACNQEYKEAVKSCEPSNGKREVDGTNVSGSGEFAARMKRLEVEQCVNQRVSQKCKEEFTQMKHVIEKDSDKAKKCMETRQRIYQLCGYPQEENAECHREHMAELEAACKM